MIAAMAAVGMTVVMIAAMAAVGMIVVVIAVVDALPRTPRGKLDRQALAATLATVRTVGSPDAPVTTNQTVNAPPS